MYIPRLHAFVSLGGVFPLISPLNILHTFLSLFPPCCRVSSSLPSSTAPPGARPSASLSPPSFRLSSAPPAFCVFRGCCVSPAVFCCVPFRLPVPVPCSVLCVCAPEALRRPSVCPAAVCRLVAAVTRPPSGAKQCDSVGRCTVYMSPALSPLAYVLPLLVPCVPLSVPLLVPWLVLPAVVCRLVVTIACTPLYPGRRLCGAASEV